jgi:molybdopterin converting factor small subunit
MASIIVRFYGLWSRYLETDRLSIEADNVEGALTQVEERFGSRLRQQLEEFRVGGIQVNGKIQDYSLVLLNGINIRNLKLTGLKEGDVLHILPPATGG